ncbi:MAG TPA: LytR C-terminal domain-containing protein [Actinomycetaceae bacterium]|nr:LytR C-terminal domain-containing protein [Actinomycetaceae bacterium]
MSEYPEDEFDVAGRERGPEGVHREPRSLLRVLAPFLAVIVIVPLLAWGVVSLMSDDGDQQAEEPPTEQVEPTTEPEDSATEEPTSEEATTEEATEEETGADVILTTSVSVLNGAGVSGIAGEQAAILEEEGFTSVGAADYGSSAPDVTTLYYRNADLAPTAEAIGELLGIDNLVEAASATQNVEIAIVLRPDFL